MATSIKQTDFEKALRDWDSPSKALLIMRLCWHLTIVGREAFDERMPDATKIRLLQTLNEMQHGLIQQAEAYLGTYAGFEDPETFISTFRRRAAEAGFGQSADVILDRVTREFSWSGTQEEHHGQA